MIRQRKLIGKADLFNWLDNPDVAKITIIRSDNKRLKNPNVCDVLIYFHSTTQSVAEVVNGICGSCKKAIEDDSKQKFLSESDHAYLNGIQSQKIHQVFSASMIKKLLKIQETYKISLNISQEIRNLVEKYS